MNNWQKRVGGLKPKELDPRDYKYKSVYKSIDLPEEYNKDVIYYVHDQGEINNCAAHALSTYIEILLKSKSKFKPVSFPWFYGNRNYTELKDQGLISRDLLKTAQKDGGLYFVDYNKIEEMQQAMFTFNDLFPKFKDKAQNMRIGNYYQCNTVDEVKEAVYKYGSVLIGTYLFQSFGNVATGKTLYMNEPIFEDIGGGAMSLEPEVGGHMMIIVGWIKDYFIVQNSWGTSFGKNGYFYMPFSLATWNERTGFPIPVFEAWAIDGVYLDGKFTTFGKNEVEPPVEPEEPTEPEYVKGWKKVGDKWQYIVDNKPFNGLREIGGDWYFFENDYMKTNGWFKKDGKWLYSRTDGVVVNNRWQKIDGKWYWFDENCYAITGFRNVDGVDYYFAEQGFGKIKECECMIPYK